MVNYVTKDTDEIFFQWDNDKTDVAIENLVNFIVACKGSWKWIQECWLVEGIKPWTNHVYVKQ